MQAAAFNQHSLPLVHANLVLWQPYEYKCHNSILVGRQGFPSSVDTRCRHRVRNPRLTGCGHPLGNLRRNLQKNLFFLVRMRVFFLVGYAIVNAIYEYE